MIDTNRLRLARDSDYETGSALCREGADEIERLRSLIKWHMIRLSDRNSDELAIALDNTDARAIWNGEHSVTAHEEQG